MVRSLFQRMVFLHLPRYLQYEALHEENLLADESQTVYFNFALKEPDQFGLVCQEDIWNRIGKLLKDMFAKELSDHSCPSLEEFIKKVEEYQLPGYLEALRAYETVYQELAALDEKNAIKPKSFGFRLWERIKKLFRYLKYVLFVIVAAALIWYLVYTIQHPSYQDGEVVNYQSIGTLRISEP